MWTIEWRYKALSLWAKPIYKVYWINTDGYYLRRSISFSSKWSFISQKQIILGMKQEVCKIIKFNVIISTRIAVAIYNQDSTIYIRKAIILWTGKTDVNLLLSVQLNIPLECLPTLRRVLDNWVVCLCVSSKLNCTTTFQH